MEDLLEFIVSEMYGETSAAVAKCLLQHGDLSLRKLQEYTALQFVDVRNVVVALMQQNVVQTLGPDDNIKYRLLKHEVLARLRFPKYVKLAESLHQSGSIVEAVLENGSLTRSELAERLGTSSESFQKRLNSLVEAGVLKPLGRSVAAVVPVEKPQKRKGGNFANALIKKMKLEKGSTKVETERVPAAGEEVSYRLSFDHMDKKLMGQLIAELVEAKIGHRAALLCEALFMFAQDRPVKVKEILQHTTGMKFTADEVTNLFTGDMADFVAARTVDTFALDLEKVLKLLRQQMVQKIVQQHFGEVAGRVFLVLNTKGFMDEKNLTELTLLPPRETQKCLNELFTAGILVTQEVPERGLFYGLRFKEVCMQLARNVLQGMLNLKIRLKAELTEAWARDKNETSQIWTTYREMENRTESALLELERTYMVLAWS